MQDRNGYFASKSFTRPGDTNAYNAGDVVGDGTPINFAELGPSGAEIVIRQVDLLIEASGLIASEASYSLHLYNALPATYADNAAHDLAAADRSKYVGSLVIGTPVDLGATLFVSAAAALYAKLKQGAALWGYLTTAGGYTPTASRVYTVRLHSHIPN